MACAQCAALCHSRNALKTDPGLCCTWLTSALAGRLSFSRLIAICSPILTSKTTRTSRVHLQVYWPVLINSSRIARSPTFLCLRRAHICTWSAASCTIYCDLGSGYALKHARLTQAKRVINPKYISKCSEFCSTMSRDFGKWSAIPGEVPCLPLS